MTAELSLTARQSFSKLDQPGELLLLLGNPVRIPFFIFGTGICSGLFNQFIDILPYDGNALVKLSNRWLRHWRYLSRLEAQALDPQ